MSTQEIEITSRPLNMTKGELRKAREVNKKIPASIYGKSLGESKPIFVEKRPHQLHKGHVCQMKWDGKPVMATIDQIQRDPITRNVIHMSLHAVEKGEEVTVELPLTTTGEAPGEKEGGITTLMTQTLQVTGVPGKLPETVTVDVSDLELNGSKTIQDLTLPEGITWKENDLEETVVTCKAPQAQEESTEAQEPEVIGEEATESESETTEETTNE